MNPLPYGYKAFGDERYKNNTSAFSVSARYTGQVLDEDTGLYYYGARYYDPQLARFSQPDSVVPEDLNSQALNRYSYCINNPLKFTDPTGQSLFSFIATLLISAIVASATGGDPAKAVAAAAIAYLTFNAMNPALGQPGMFGKVGGAVLSAAAAGAAASAAIGQDPGVPAAAAALGAYIVTGVFKINPTPGNSEPFSRAVIKEWVISKGVNIGVGGVAAEWQGAPFMLGAKLSTVNAGTGLIGTWTGTNSTNCRFGANRLAWLGAPTTAPIWRLCCDIPYGRGGICTTGRGCTTRCWTKHRRWRWA